MGATLQAGGVVDRLTVRELITVMCSLSPGPLPVDEVLTSWGCATSPGSGPRAATHYLEEADAFADRVVLMAHGRIVADGPTTEIKAAVGGRTVRATLPGAVAAELQRLPGVTDAELHGQTVILAVQRLRRRAAGAAHHAGAGA